MSKNDPPAPVETLPHSTGPDKAAMAVARMGLDRLRLWLRGDMSVGLDDRDIIALETVSGWLRDGAVLNARSVRLVSVALSHGRSLAIIDPCMAISRDDAVAQLDRALEVLRGE